MFIKEVLTQEGKELFKHLAPFKDDFYLAGGTGLAILIGHRVSLDFDLFSEKPIKKTLLKSVESVFEPLPVSASINNKDELTVMVGAVKCTFLRYPFPVLLPCDVSISTVRILSAKEILATKAYTIGRRGAYKDYVDLFVGLSDNLISLTELIELATKKYGEGFNDRLFLEQLLYLDDVEPIAVAMLNRSLPNKKELLTLFSEKIAELKI